MKKNIVPCKLFHLYFLEFLFVYTLALNKSCPFHSQTCVRLRLLQKKSMYVEWKKYIRNFTVGLLSTVLASKIQMCLFITAKRKVWAWGQKGAWSVRCDSKQEVTCVSLFFRKDVIARRAWEQTNNSIQVKSTEHRRSHVFWDSAPVEERNFVSVSRNWIKRKKEKKVCLKYKD